MSHHLRGWCALASALAVACAAPPTPRGIVIVTHDTTRADRLSAYGFSGIATPALDRIATDGIVFEHATTVAPLTLPAHTSLFTGLYPLRHGVRDNANALREDTPTLAAILHGHGFLTAAFIGSVVLDHDRGLARGFDVYDDDLRDPASGEPRHGRPANQVVDRAITWLGTVGDARFFLWVHLYDPHFPYVSPEPFASAYLGQPYFGAIAFADSELARLLDALERAGLSDRAVVVVASDHGESLGEHGEDTHGLLLYESVLHVPLIMRVPGYKARRVSEDVSLVDIVPTLLDLERLPRIASDGESLRRVLAGHAGAERPIYSESQYPRRFGWSALGAVRDARYKLIDGPMPELYDLKSDPGEQRDVGELHAHLTKAFHALLTTTTSGSGTPVPDATVRDRLSALGYVSGRSTRRPAMSENPRDHVSEYNAMVRRMFESARGRD